MEKALFGRRPRPKVLEHIKDGNRNGTFMGRHPDRAGLSWQGPLLRPGNFGLLQQR